MDYLHFFDFREDPFKLTPDPAFFYPSTSHNEGLLMMDYAIDQREGFLLVIGDPGTGKTTLLKVFLEKWLDRAEIAMVLTPGLTPEEFLIALAEDLNIKSNTGNKNEIIRSLRDFMLHKSAVGRRVIVIVDEAQNLPSETLEELRLLSNLETDKDKLIQIILVGQPELESKLRSASLRQLNQRITTRIYLKHLNREETVDYVNFRAIKAGKKNLQIDKKARQLLHRHTGGIPRLINMLIARALMAAYVEETSTIIPQHINHAIRSLNHSDMKIRSHYALLPAALGILAMIGISLFMYFVFSDRGEIHKEYSPEVAMNSPQKADTENHLPPKNEPSSPHAPVRSSVPQTAIRDLLHDLKLIAVTTDVAIIRTHPSMGAAKAGWAGRGSQLLVLNQSFDERNKIWYQISHQGQKRWISEDVVEEYMIGAETLKSQ